MTKQELEQKRQKCGEALTAWKEVIKGAKESQRPEDKDEKTWLSEWQEKKEKAQAVYTKLANELAAHDASERDDADIAEAERFMNAPTGRLPGGYKDPAQARLNGGTADAAASYEATHFSTTLERRAYQIEMGSGAFPDQRTRNIIRGMRGEAKTYKKLNLSADQKEAYNKYFYTYCAFGPGDPRVVAASQKLQEVAPEQFALLTTGGDTGATLVPDDFQAEVIRDLAGFAVFRGIARVERTGKDTFVFPTVTAASAARAAQGYPSGFTGSWKAQRTTSGGGVALTTQDQPKFGQERIQVHRWEPDVIEVSLEFLDDPEADIEGVLAEVIAETRAHDEDLAFTSGDGQGQPLGILNEGLSTVISGATSTLLYAGLLNLFTTLRAQYRVNATWMMNSLTFGAVLALQDSGSHLIFPPNALPNTMWGRPMVFNEFLADVGAAAIPIVFGDFRFYVIADRMELRVQRLVERLAPNVGLLPFARLGGQVVRTNAFRTQTVST